jgi:hypothetical protein
MCKFFSGIVMRNLDIIHDAEHTDSHEDLISVNNIKDGNVQLYGQGFARFEFTPPKNSKTIGDISTWNFHIDENVIPNWATENFQEIRAKIERIVNRMFINDERQLLLGGCWILLENAEIVAAKCTKIAHMSGNSVVNNMSGNSVVNNMYDNSVVNNMYGNSVVNNMYDNSVVNNMSDNSVVNNMYDNSVVNSMSGNSVVKDMSGNSVVNNMSDNSAVKYMSGNSVVNNMSDNSVVPINAKIINDFR